MFIKRIISVILVMILFTVMFSSCQYNALCTEEFFALDTYISASVSGKNGEELIDGVRKIINDFESRLSTTNNKSEIYNLNQNKTATFDSDCINLLKHSLKLCETTEGVFDITVFPVVNAWGFISNDHRIPSDKELNELRNAIDYKQVKIEGNTVTIPKNVQIDLGGCAKGYIGDKCAEYLESKGVKYAVISLGGNIRTVGEKSPDQKFSVGIEHPDTHDVFATLSCDDTNIITSGAYQRNFVGEDGNFYHHIIDPMTAKPTESDIKSVTVISKDGTFADSYSTAIFIMGLEKGIRFIKNNNLNVVILTNENEAFVSESIVSDIKLTEKYTDIRMNIIK